MMMERGKPVSGRCAHLYPVTVTPTKGARGQTCPLPGLRSEDGRAGPENPGPSAYLRRVAVQGYFSEKNGGCVF
jgi:hypothetical protein